MWKLPIYDCDKKNSSSFAAAFTVSWLLAIVSRKKILSCLSIFWKRKDFFCQLIAIIHSQTEFSKNKKKFLHNNLKKLNDIKAQKSQVPQWILLSWRLMFKRDINFMVEISISRGFKKTLLFLSYFTLCLADLSLFLLV